MGYHRSLLFASFPCLVFIILVGGIWACFGWSSSEGHAGHVGNLTYWPYVSDTGTQTPESCLFTLIMTWGAFFTCTTSYFYYRYVIHHCGKSKINTWAFIVSFTSCIGATVVGAFQWTELFTPHIIGATVTFVGAMAYSWMIVYINFKHMRVLKHRKSLLYTRILLAVIETISFVILCISLPFTYTKGTALALNVNTISEWILIFSAIFFWSSFLYEMMEINKTSTKLQMKKDKEHVSIFLPEKIDPNKSFSDKPADPVKKLNEIERVAL